MAISKSYYAAANTEKGFLSLFGEVFSPKALSRLYVIKGGPGTGKSTFMRGIGKAAEARGLETEYYYCSADTGSLDGVKIPALGVAVIDGTPPHAHEPRYPGACEKIINLGENFDAERLLLSRAEIERLTDECSACYGRAARFLSAAGETERLALEAVHRAFDTEKAKKAARRILFAAKPACGGYAERYISALGTRGSTHIYNPPAQGENTVRICGKYGAEKLFLSVLCEQARAGGYTLVRCPDVLLPECTEAVYIKELKTRYSVSEEGEDTINAMRFVRADILAENRGKLRFAGKCREALLQGALAELAKMGRTHDELEKYYISAMDFTKSEAMRAEVEKEIFGE
ncbi:MAG: hypothetical protein IJW21_02980 [Clostridia bacterium]|nr:hypothetical protein [Clostridia bacterium]